MQNPSVHASSRGGEIARRRLTLVLVVGLLIVGLVAALMTGGGNKDGVATATGRPQAASRPRVALQVGHWKHDRMPSELRWVQRSAGGASSDGAVEWRVNLAIARDAQRMLRADRVNVDLIPATVPPGYRAAAFVSIHADGNGDPTVSGFKIAPTARDGTGLARVLTLSVARRYAQRTGLPWNTAITPDMTDYYAFDARRFRHAIDPVTPAAVLETGFLTNPEDRRVIVDAPQLAAEGIAEGVLAFLRRQHLAG